MSGLSWGLPPHALSPGARRRRAGLDDEAATRHGAHGGSPATRSHALPVADILERLASNAGYTVPLHDAIDYSRHVMEIRRRNLPDEDPRVVSSIVGPGAIYTFAGYHESANALFGEAMAIRRRAPAAEQCHVSYASLFSELAILRYRQGYFRDAERHADAAVDLGCDLLQGYLIARPGPPFVDPL